MSQSEDDELSVSIHKKTSPMGDVIYVSAYLIGNTVMRMEETVCLDKAKERANLWIHTEGTSVH